MEFRVAICDDDAVRYDQLQNMVFEYGIRNKVEFDIYIFDKVEVMVDCIDKGCRFDVVFLDEELPAVSSPERGRTVRRQVEQTHRCVIYLRQKSLDRIDVFRNLDKIVVEYGGECVLGVEPLFD
jgi:hypothetical protein